MKSHHMSGIDIFALVLVILGAINLGLEGFFEYNLIKSVFGDVSVLIRVVYALIGVSAIWVAFQACKCGRHKGDK